MPFRSEVAKVSMEGNAAIERARRRLGHFGECKCWTSSRNDARQACDITTHLQFFEKAALSGVVVLVVLVVVDVVGVVLVGVVVLVGFVVVLVVGVVLVSVVVLGVLVVVTVVAVVVR